MHGTDDGYFYLGSAHGSLGIDREAIKRTKADMEIRKEIEALRQQIGPASASSSSSSRSWMLWGGAALAVAAIAFVVMKKKGGAA